MHTHVCKYIYSFGYLLGERGGRMTLHNIFTFDLTEEKVF